MGFTKEQIKEATELTKEEILSGPISEPINELLTDDKEIIS